MSSRRVGESSNQDYNYESGDSVSSSLSDENELFENINKIEMKLQKKKSILIKVPREIVNVDEDESGDDVEEELKSQEKEISYNPDLFDLNE